MISKNTTKLIKSLSIKKYRQKESLFLVEGDKIVLEVLHSEYIVKKLIGTPDFLSKNETELKKVKEIVEATSDEIKNASLLKNPQISMAICEIQESQNLH